MCVSSMYYYVVYVSTQYAMKPVCIAMRGRLVDAILCTGTDRGDILCIETECVFVYL